MLSDKKFKREEIPELLRQFGQGLANKLPGAEVTIKPDQLTNGALVTIRHNGKVGTRLLTVRNGHVEMTTVMGF